LQRRFRFESCGADVSGKAHIAARVSGDRRLSRERTASTRITWPSGESGSTGSHESVSLSETPSSVCAASASKMSAIGHSPETIVTRRRKALTSIRLYFTFSPDYEEELAKRARPV